MTEPGVTVISLENEDEEEANKATKSSDKGKSKKPAKDKNNNEKYLNRIRWRTITPTLWAEVTAKQIDSLGDLTLFSSVAYKEYVICVGGTSETHGPFRGYRFIPTLHITDAYSRACCCCCKGQWTPSATWKYREATGDIPIMRYGQRIALINNTIFMFGGRAAGTEKLLNDLHALDLESMIWTQLKPSGAVPSARIRHTLTYIDGFLYLLGGNGVNSSIFSKDPFWRYDIRNGTWDTLPPCPTTDGVIAGHAAASAAGTQALVVFGGCSSIFGRESNLFMFDTAEGKWEHIEAENDTFNPSLVPEDHAVASYVSEGHATFFFHGGITTAGSPNQISILKQTSPDDFEWHYPTVRDINVFTPPVELAKHNIVLMKDRLLFIGGTSEFGRESEELANSGCCGVGAYKALSSSVSIPLIFLKGDKLQSNGCCTIL